MGPAWVAPGAHVLDTADVGWRPTRLVVAAVGMLVTYIAWPDEGLELACYVFAVPVMVANAWEWNLLKVKEEEE